MSCQLAERSPGTGAEATASFIFDSYLHSSQPKRIVAMKKSPSIFFDVLSKDGIAEDNLKQQVITAIQDRDGAVSPELLLEQFTPELILKELLGDLFVHPNRLEEVRKYGEGAFASVSKCVLSAPGGVGLKVQVAVKRLKPEVLESADDLKEFLGEANLLRKLNHPNIVRTVGIGASDLSTLDGMRGSMYIVMEAMDGDDLKMMVVKQMTGRTKAYTHRDAMRWLTHLAEAMDYLHRVCRPMIIHRDIKLENVMTSGGLTEGRVAKLADFGLHKRARFSKSMGILVSGGPSMHESEQAMLMLKDPSFRGLFSDKSYYGGALHESSRRDKSMKRSNSSARVGGNIEEADEAAALEAAEPFREEENDTGSTLSLLAKAEMSAGNIVAQNGKVDAQAAGPRLMMEGLKGGDAALQALRASGHMPPHNGGSTPAAAALDVAAEEPSSEDQDKHNPLPTHAASSTEEQLLKTAIRKSLAKYDTSNDSTDVAAAPVALGMVKSTSNPGLNSMSSENSRKNSNAKVKQANNHSYHGAGNGLASLMAAGCKDQNLQNLKLALALADSSSGSVEGVLSGSMPFGARTSISSEPELEKNTQDFSNGGGGSLYNASRKLAGSHHGGSEHQIGGSRLRSSSQVDAVEDILAKRNTEDGSMHRKMMALIALDRCKFSNDADKQENLCVSPKITFTPKGSSATVAAPFHSQQLVPAIQAPASGGIGLSSKLTGYHREGSMHTIMEDTHMDNKQEEDTASKADKPALAKNSQVAEGKETIEAQKAKRLHEEQLSTERQAMEKEALWRAEARVQKEKLQNQSIQTTAMFADATRQVGSLMYMAPELLNGHEYNEKVDVFSFAIVAYELISGKLMAMRTEFLMGGVASVEEYAQRRAKGHREQIPIKWPAPVRKLIEEMWAQDPAQRPSFHEIAEQLRKMQHEHVWDAFEQGANSGGHPSCCSIM